MSADDLVGQELTEKLAKLDSSQKSIESLSRWCIDHRTKGKLIVETWDKMFKSAQCEQLVILLYLANDILQNSRRKGSDFVNEFWKFLPAALKLVCENGDEKGRKVASRLVDIWEEKKFFGSRGQNLKEEVLGKSNPHVSVSGKNPNLPIKIIKRDAQSLRLKLAVGGLPEKIISAFQLVLHENVSEESAVKKCDFAISLVKEMEKDVEKSSVSGFQALIQYHSQQNAVAARNALQGRNIYDGCCQLDIQFSNLDELQVNYNNDRSRDYTNSSLPSEQSGRSSHTGYRDVGVMHPSAAGALAAYPQRLCEIYRVMMVNTRAEYTAKNPSVSGRDPLTCSHCAGPLSRDMVTSRWTVPPLIRDSFSMIGSAVGGTASAFYGFNHVMPVVQRSIKGPMWLHFLIGAPPVIIFSSACAGFAGGAVPALAQLASSTYHAAFESPSLPPSASRDENLTTKSRTSSTP